MYFDSLTTAAVADEFRQNVLGGRVQRIVPIDPLSIGMEIYHQGTRFQVLASAHPQYPRLYLVDYKPRRGLETASPFFLLVRKYLQGARLVGVEQPPFERIIRLIFAGEEGETSLLVELIDRRANLILLQEERIIDAILRVGPEMNRYRTVLPNHPYVPPPSQSKSDPTDVTENFLEKKLSESGPEEKLWRVLVGSIAGVSPLLAREVVFRATGNARQSVSDGTFAAQLVDAFENMLIHYWEHRWQPSTVLDVGGNATVFAPYLLTHLEMVQESDSISQALTDFYDPLVGNDAYQAAKKPVREALNKALRRVQKKRDALARQVPDPDTLENLRKQGELILAYATGIKPHQTELKAQYDLDGPVMDIKLDPGISAIANAQRYFREYEKTKRATAHLPKRLKLANGELAFLAQLETDLELGASWPDIDEVAKALESSGYMAKLLTRPRGSSQGPLRIVSPDGLVIWVGRNSRQNEIVTFKKASSQDIWFHAKGVPGGHVIIKHAGGPVPQQTIQLAAGLAAFYSAAGKENSVPVDMVPRKTVRRQRGIKTRPGLVNYRGEETLLVSPISPKTI